MTLWGKDKIAREPWVPIETLDTWDNFPIIELHSFVADNEGLALECRATRERLVDNLVELIGVVIRKPEFLNNLV